MANRQLIDGAMRLSAANTFNVKTSDPPFPLVPYGNSYVTRETDLVVSNVYTNNVWVDPTGGFNGSNVLSSGGNIDFWLNDGQYDVIDSITIAITIANNTGAAVTFPAVPQLINRIDITANNGSDLISSFDGDYVYALTSTYNSTTWGLKSTAMNTTAQWGNNAVGIADGASSTYYVLLKDILLNELKFNMKYLQGNIRVTISLRPWSISGASGLAPSISKIGLILNQVVLDQSDQAAKMAVYRDVGNGIPPPIMVRYLDAIRFTPSTLTMAASSTYKFPLSNIFGMISHVYFFLRSAGSTGFGLNDMKLIDSFDFQDNNGNTIIQYPQPSAFNLTQEFNQFFPQSAMTLYKNLYTYSFNTSPIDSYELGYQTGFFPFTGFESIVINTPAGFTGGNYDLVAYFVQYKTLAIQNGKIIPMTPN